MGWRVFVCRDHTLDPQLDELSSALVANGIAVTRGPATEPGRKLSYPQADYPHLFGSADVAVFTSRSIASAGLLRAAPRLRAVVNLSAGLETVDLQAADQMAIAVGHGATPENTISMAEAAVMLILNLRLQLRASEQVMRGERPRPAAVAGAMHASMLRGCTVGIIGLGRIGLAVVERLRPFRVNLIALPPRSAGRPLPDDVTAVDLDTLMSSSDIVALFASAGPGSRGLIDERAIARMKPTACLVNVARGELVDEPALCRALAQRRIAGAALDVFAVEPLPADSPLRQLDNVILTPHLVGHTREVYQRFVPTALENILRSLAGELPLHCANPDVEPRWRARLEALGNGCFSRPVRT
jgi:phosphoglycerate dehydrogenase-like enzyme